jgi:hypothetical protein
VDRVAITTFCGIDGIGDRVIRPGRYLTTEEKGNHHERRTLGWVHLLFLPKKTVVASQNSRYVVRIEARNEIRKRTNPV